VVVSAALAFTMHMHPNSTCVSQPSPFKTLRPKTLFLTKHISYSWLMSWIIESQPIHASMETLNSLKGSSRSKFLPPLGSYSTSEPPFLNREKKFDWNESDLINKRNINCSFPEDPSATSVVSNWVRNNFSSVFEH